MGEINRYPMNMDMDVVKVSIRLSYEEDQLVALHKTIPTH